eukprot:jgi/Tetstr1/420660/TSEL_011748.t1
MAGLLAGSTLLPLYTSGSRELGAAPRRPLPPRVLTHPVTASASRRARPAAAASAVAVRPDATHDALLVELAALRASAPWERPSTSDDEEAARSRCDSSLQTSNTAGYFMNNISRDPRLGSLNFRRVGKQPGLDRAASRARAARRLQRRAAAVSASHSSTTKSRATSSATGHAARMSRRRQARRTRGTTAAQAQAAANASSAHASLSREDLLAPGGAEAAALLDFLSQRTTDKMPNAAAILCCEVMQAAVGRGSTDFLRDVAALAEHTLMAAHESMMHKLAWRISKGEKMMYHHLLAEAQKQLPVAAANYRADHARGAAFSTYFYQCAWAVMKRLEGYHSDVLHMPDRTRNRLRVVQRELARTDSQEMPSSEKLAAATGLKKEDVADVQVYIARKQSSYEAMVDSGLPFLPQEAAAEMQASDAISTASRVEVSAVVEAALERLNDEERRVLELKFALGGVTKEHTTAAVARALGRSRQGVYKMEQRALAKLREHLQGYDDVLTA